jgi:hypothetical protein
MTTEETIQNLVWRINLTVEVPSIEMKYYMSGPAEDVRLYCRSY